VILKALKLWFFYLGPLLSVPFLFLLGILPYGTSWRDVPARARMLLLICGCTFLGIALLVPIEIHYAAPLTAAIYALIVIAMQRVRHWRRGEARPGVLVVRLTAALALMLFFVNFGLELLHVRIWNAVPMWSSQWVQLRDRERVEKQLKSALGRQLVIVHYGPNHPESEAWVNNAADIDNSQVVWAHDMGETGNQELIRYFADRNTWLVYPDENPVRLMPYSAGIMSADGATKVSLIRDTSRFAAK
jgi:hypothetical protein